MSDQPFAPDQQEYLKGFLSGVEARRAALGLPLAPVSGAMADPNDLQRLSQDRVVAEFDLRDLLGMQVQQFAGAAVAAQRQDFGHLAPGKQFE